MTKHSTWVSEFVLGTSLPAPQVERNLVHISRPETLCRPGSGADHPYKKHAPTVWGQYPRVEGILRVQVVTKEVWQMEFGRIRPDSAGRGDSLNA